MLRPHDLYWHTLNLHSYAYSNRKWFYSDSTMVEGMIVMTQMVPQANSSMRRSTTHKYPQTSHMKKKKDIITYSTLLCSALHHKNKTKYWWLHKGSFYFFICLTWLNYFFPLMVQTCVLFLWWGEGREVQYLTEGSTPCTACGQYHTVV